jgi:Zn finger protein HypA/HybF involved in hydrogenase expression
MHEMSLLKGLLKQIEEIRNANGGGLVRTIRLKVGPLAHIEPDHLRKHFLQAVRHTPLETANLIIESTEELHELTLESIEVDARS